MMPTLRTMCALLSLCAALLWSAGCPGSSADADAAATDVAATADTPDQDTPVQADTGVTDSQPVTDAQASDPGPAVDVPPIDTTSPDTPDADVPGADLGGSDEGPDTAADAGDVLVPLPEEPAAQTPTEFAFESGSDDVSVALADVLSAYRTSPQTSGEAQALAQNRAAGLAALAADPETAAAALIAEIGALGALDVINTAAAYHLLGSFESVTGVDYLRDRALAPLPAKDPALDGVWDVIEPRLVAQQLRTVAVDHLGRRASAGSALAKTHLATLVAQGDPDVRRRAVKRYYDASPQRWRAKRALSKQLPYDQRYLLHQIY